MTNTKYRYLAPLLATLGAFYNLKSGGPNIPNIPHDSHVNVLPPWFAFNIAQSIKSFGTTLATLMTPPHVQIINMATAYWRSEVLYSLTANGIIDQIGRNNADTCLNIAMELNLQVYPVCEFMRAGEKLGLLKATATNPSGSVKYALSKTGSLLQSDAPASLSPFVSMVNEDQSLQAYRAAGTISLRTARSGFYEVHGQEWFPWLVKHPDRQEQFDKAMQNRAYSATGSLLADWKPDREDLVFCDIGGGIGTSLAVVLEHYPAMTGMVLDMPSVMERSQEFFEQRGLTERAQFLGGSFFEPFPLVLSGCDVFFLKGVVHNWGDEEVMTILQGIKSAANKTDAKLVVVDNILETGDSSSMETSKALMSIAMYAARYGARERTVQHHRDLFTAAGFQGSEGTTLIPLRDILSALEVTI